MLLCFFLTFLDTAAAAAAAVPMAAMGPPVKLTMLVGNQLSGAVQYCRACGCCSSHQSKHDDQL